MADISSIFSLITAITDLVNRVAQNNEYCKGLVLTLQVNLPIIRALGISLTSNEVAAVAIQQLLSIIHQAKEIILQYQRSPVHRVLRTEWYRRTMTNLNSQIQTCISAIVLANILRECKNEHSIAVLQQDNAASQSMSSHKGLPDSRFATIEELNDEIVEFEIRIRRLQVELERDPEPVDQA